MLKLRLEIAELLLVLAVAGLGFSAFRTTRWAGLIIAALGIVPSIWFAYRDWKYLSAYEGASVGDTRQALVEGIGPATDVTLGHDDPDGGYFFNVHDCAFNLWYNAFFAIERYQFCYSSDDRLLDKYRWSSW